jgi:DNA polymerase-3 subunit gamma/tau
MAPQPPVIPESRLSAPPQAVPEPVPARIDLAAAAMTTPAAVSAQTGSAEQAQRRVIDALRNAKQSSAADAMEDSVWTIVDGEARIQTELSKTMLPVVMNAEAEKILRAVTREAGTPRLTLLPGTPSSGATKKPKTTRTGSVQAKAMEHPMVQQAQKLFNAEIQTVIDLREGE